MGQAWSWSGMELWLGLAEGTVAFQKAGSSPSWAATLTLARVKLRKGRALSGSALRAGLSSWPVSGRLLVTRLGWTNWLRWFSPTEGCRDWQGRAEPCAERWVFWVRNVLIVHTQVWPRLNMKWQSNQCHFQRITVSGNRKLFSDREWFYFFFKEWN